MKLVDGRCTVDVDQVKETKWISARSQLVKPAVKKQQEEAAEEKKAGQRQRYKKIQIPFWILPTSFLTFQKILYILSIEEVVWGSSTIFQSLPLERFFDEFEFS